MHTWLQSIIYKNTLQKGDTYYMNIQLSISLLASDRAASLERCLDSLRPLLMQIPSELIVVFTGTDTRVREIASRYTDKVLPFTWCNNFSAARNVGLWAAKGEWFLYIDDDEWFEDVTEIRDFFLSGEYQNFGSACYIQKNFTEWDGIHFSDYHAFRMARIVPGIAFENTVHEEIVPRLEPCKYFNAYVNHYGYISDTGKLSVEKSSRNLPLLLKNIQERPSYVKNYLQIVQEYLIASDLEKAEEYCRKGRKLCQNYQDNFYRSWLQVNLLAILYEKGDYEKTEQEALLMLEKEHPWELARLDIYATLLAIYTKRGASEEVLQYGIQFEETLAGMDAKPELWIQQSYGDLTEGRIKAPSKLYQIRLSCTESALKLGDIKQAVYFLVLLPWEEENWMQQYYPIFDNWSKSYNDFPELLSHFPEDSPYWQLQKAIGQAGAIDNIKRQEAFIQCMEGTESAYLHHQALKEAILQQANLCKMVSVMGLDIWKQCAANVKELIPPEETDKLERAAEGLVRDNPLYGFWLKKLLCEKELIRGYLTGDRLIHSLEQYIGYILQFYQIQYREEMFSPENRSQLPKDCQSALCISEALKKIKCLEFPEAVRMFRKAIRFYPSMTSVIREVIRQMTAMVNTPVQNTGDEFRMLARQMKDTLKVMISNQQYADALPIVLQLSPLLPEDLELLRMRQTILQETIG